jgi:hypothetical protein
VDKDRARDATRLEPLVRFFSLFLFLLLINLSRLRLMTTNGTNTPLLPLPPPLAASPLPRPETRLGPWFSIFLVTTRARDLSRALVFFFTTTARDACLEPCLFYYYVLLSYSTTRDASATRLGYVFLCFTATRARDVHLEPF